MGEWFNFEVEGTGTEGAMNDFIRPVLCYRYREILNMWQPKKMEKHK